jgi:phospholipid transport system substrate-binding protein
MALTRRGIFAVLAVLLVSGAAQAARPPKKAEHEQRLGQLVNNVRYAQDVTALDYLDGDGQAKFLLADAYDKGTPEQRAEFVKLFHHIFAGVAFPRMRNNFEHLKTITYGPAEEKAGRTHVPSVIFIQAAGGMKEQEISVAYELAAGADKKLRVVDVTVKGDKSMLTNIRDDQIQPILKEGGWPKLLELLRAKAAELPAPADKPLAK